MMIVYSKGYKVAISQVKEIIHRARSGKVSEVEFPCPVPRNQGLSLASTSTCLSTRELIQAMVYRVSIEISLCRPD